MFLWRFPSGRPAPPLAGILTLWSSDFPPSRAPVGARDGGRPATSTLGIVSRLGRSECVERGRGLDSHVYGIVLDDDAGHVLAEKALLVLDVQRVPALQRLFNVERLVRVLGGIPHAVQIVQVFAEPLPS